MTKNEALEIIDRLPYIPAITATKESVRFELYEEYLSSADIKDVVKVIKSCYVRMYEKGVRKAVNPKEENYYNTAKERFHREMAEVLEIRTDDVENFIKSYLSDEI